MVLYNIPTTSTTGTGAAALQFVHARRVRKTSRRALCLNAVMGTKDYLCTRSVCLYTYIVYRRPARDD